MSDLPTDYKDNQLTESIESACRANIFRLTMVGIANPLF